MTMRAGDISRAASRAGSWSVAGWLVVPVAVFTLFFGPLFTDVSLLGFDNRLMAPFVAHLNGDEPTRRMNLLSSDINGWILPETMMQLNRLRHGELPLWNPYMNCGQPLLANLGFPPFYPSVVLYLILDPLRAYAWEMALHLLLLGWGMQLLLRRFGRSPPAALLGALTLAFCGFVGVHIHLPHFIRTAAWFPLILWTSERLITAPGRLRAASLGLMVGLSLLAGFPQLALINLFAAAVFFLVRLISSSGRLATLGWASCALLLGGLLGAVHLLPALELKRHSWRDVGLDARTAAIKRLEPELLAGLVLPRLFGDVAWSVDVNHPVPRQHRGFPTYRAWLNDDVQNNFIENTLYVGLIPLALVLLAVAGRSRRGDLLVGLLGLAGLAIALDLPGFGAASRALPGVSSGSPKRALFITGFALAWLSASGLERLLLRSVRRDRVVVLLVAAGLLAVGTLVLFPFEGWLVPGASQEERLLLRTTLTPDLVWLLIAGVGLLLMVWLALRGHRLVLAGVVVALTAVDLIGFTWSANPLQPYEEQYEATSASTWLADRCGLDGARSARLASPLCFPAEIAQIFGIRSVNGTGALVLRRTGELLRAIEPDVLDVADPRVVKAFEREAVLTSRLLDLTGTRYVVIDRRPESWPPGIRLVRESPEERLGVVERDAALPNAFLVNRLRVEPDGGRRLAYLASADFDPAAEAVLDDRPGGLQLDGWSAGECRWSRPSAEEIRVDVDAVERSFLVVTESWAPGWIAEVDGETAPLERVDHAFMGVAMGPGRHRVRLIYRPAGFVIGAICLLLALVSLAALAVPRSGHRRARAGRAPVPPTGNDGDGSAEAGGPVPASCPEARGR